MRIFTLIFSGFILFNIPAISQKPSIHKYKFETDIGYGFPESICIKAKYGNKIQFGLSQAFDTQGLGSSSLEFYYHVGEKPRLLPHNPWYFMGGVSVYIFDVDYKKEYGLLFYPRAGRSFFFSDISGFNVDIGLGFPFNRDIESVNTISPIILTGSIALFLKF